MTDQTLQLLLSRLDHLTAEFNELRDGVMKAVRISDDDPEMALTRARKVLEYVVRDVFRLRCNEDPGTRPLENLLQRLVKDGHLPKRLSAYASYIRDLGNVGTHVYGEDLTKDDVRRSFENLTAILEWYFERVRPDAFMKGEVPAREEMEVRRVAEKEARRTDEELGRKIREAEELKRPEAEARAAKGPAQTTQNRVSQDVNRLVHLQEEKAQLLAPPSSPPTVRRINLLGTVCLLAGLLGFLGHIGGVLAPIAILLGLLLIGLNIARLGLKKMTGLHAVGPAPLPSHAYKPYPSPAAPPHRSFLSRAFSGTVGKIIFGAICGLVGGAVAAPILDFYKPEPIFAALLVGVLHGLAIGFILIPFSKILPGKIITSLVGIFIGMIVGVTIRAIIASMFGNLYWYMSASDGQAIEIMGGGILGFILGLVHGSKKTVR